MKLFYCLVFTIGLNVFGQAQVKNKTRMRPEKKQINPRAVIAFSALSVFALTDNDFIGRYEVREFRNERLPHFSTHVDDYLQHLPLAMLIVPALFDKQAFGLKKGVVLRLAKSQLICTGLVVPLKKILRVPRPDGRGFNSFPSGHTAQAFMAAAFLDQELGGRRRWMPVIGYAAAGSVAVFRVLNNRHWSADVLAGAAIGILSVKLANRKSNHKKISTNVTPLIDMSGAKGLSLRIELR